MPRPRIDMKPHRLSFKGMMRNLGRIIGTIWKQYPIQFILVIFATAISTIASVYGSVFMGQIIDFIDTDLKAATAIEEVHFDELAKMVIIMGVIYLVGLLSNYAYQRMTAVMSQGVQKKIRDQLFNQMETLPISYFDWRSHGDIMSIYTNDIDSLREMMSRAFPLILSATISICMVLVTMIMQSWLLTLVVLAFFVIELISMYIITKNSAKFFIAQQKALAKANGYIQEHTTGQKVVKVFNYEERAMKGFDVLNEDLCRFTTKAQRFSSILGPVTNNLGNMQFGVLALIGAYGIINNVPGLTVGVIVSFLSLSKAFMNPVSQVSQQINMVSMALAGAERIFNLIDTPSEVDEGYVILVNAKKGEDGSPIETKERTGLWAWKHPHKEEGKTTYTWLKGDIEMDHVDFSYIPGKQVLTDVSLYAKPGQKIAFVGPTGAGKTTITNLLNRFYDIEDGKIRYDGININKIKKADLRKSLGMVLQDTALFTGTVRENIAYGNPDATEEDIVNAAKLANADNFIRMLPDGYDTMLENAGAGLSQGQRQLLSIARCAVANPPVMILDEATSSIDSHTEELVQEGMDRIMKGRTVFVIAHRLSTVKNSDAIMVLKHGEVTERGNHESLIAQKGKYYQLYTGGKNLEEE